MITVNCLLINGRYWDEFHVVHSHRVVERKKDTSRDVEHFEVWVSRARPISEVYFRDQRYHRHEDVSSTSSLYSSQMECPKHLIIGYFQLSSRYPQLLYRNFERLNRKIREGFLCGDKTLTLMGSNLKAPSSFTGENIQGRIHDFRRATDWNVFRFLQFR